MREINDVPNHRQSFPTLCNGKILAVIIYKIRKEDPMARLFEGSYIDDESQELCRQLCRQELHMERSRNVQQFSFWLD